MPVFDLRYRESSTGDGLNERVYGKGKFGEFIVTLPVQTWTVGITAVLACVAQTFRHLRERVQQHSTLHPENRQNQHDARNGYEQREAADRRTRRVGEGLRQRHREPRYRFSRDVAYRVNRLEGVVAELPESTRIELERLRNHRRESERYVLLPRFALCLHVRDGNSRRFDVRTRDVHFKPGKRFVHLGGERRGIEWSSKHEEPPIRTPRQGHIIGFSADANKPRRQHSLIAKRLRPLLELLRITIDILSRHRHA